MLIADIQEQLYSLYANSGGGGDGGSEFEEIDIPDMTNMSFYFSDLNMDDIGYTAAGCIGYSDTSWVLTYFFGLVNNPVFVTGDIANGQLIITGSSNPFAQDTIDLMQGLYDSATAANAAIPKSGTGNVDMAGGNKSDSTVWFTDTDWCATLYFAPVSKNILLAGTIEGGQLVLLQDSSGMAGADSLPAIQAIYDASK